MNTQAIDVPLYKHSGRTGISMPLTFFVGIPLSMIVAAILSLIHI